MRIRMIKILNNIKQLINRSCNNGLDYAELKKMMKNNLKVNLIDVRSMQEYNEGHIQKAVNLPIYNLEKSIQQRFKNKNDIIILYCQFEKRSKKGKNILEKLGYKNVYYLKGGIEEIQ